jgi:hypothetical protein
MNPNRRATLITGWRDALARALPGRKMAVATTL